jgi:hypothetical protein
MMSLGVLYLFIIILNIVGAMTSVANKEALEKSVANKEALRKCNNTYFKARGTDDRCFLGPQGTPLADFIEHTCLIHEVRSTHFRSDPNSNTRIVRGGAKKLVNLIGEKKPTTGCSILGETYELSEAGLEALRAGKGGLPVYFKVLGCVGGHFSGKVTGSNCTKKCGSAGNTDHCHESCPWAAINTAHTGGCERGTNSRQAKCNGVGCTHTKSTKKRTDGEFDHNCGYRLTISGEYNIAISVFYFTTTTSTVVLSHTI